MVRKIVASVLFCVFANGFGRPAPHLETLSADPQQRGQALAEKLREVLDLFDFFKLLHRMAVAMDIHFEVLPATGSVAQQLEPSVSQVQESEESKQSRSELLVCMVAAGFPLMLLSSNLPVSNIRCQAAASLFNAASSDNTEEQQAAEDALREAMASPSRVKSQIQHLPNAKQFLACVCISASVSLQVGRPDRNIDESASSSCLPDLSQCPHGWKKQGLSSYVILNVLFAVPPVNFLKVHCVLHLPLILVFSPFSVDRCSM